MAIADSAAVRPEAPEPVIIALTERVTEETLIALAGKNPEYRFETTADGRLVASPLGGLGRMLSGSDLRRSRYLRRARAYRFDAARFLGYARMCCVARSATAER